MKKIVLFCLLTAMLLCVCGCSFSGNIPLIPESPEEDFQYEIKNGAVIITKYIGTDQKIRVPAMIKDRPVIEIAFNAFYGYDLTYIYIPDSVEKIGRTAFADCKLLEKVVLPESLLSLGFSAFSDCSALAEIQIPDKLRVIETDTFSGCSSLEYVKLPDGLQMIKVGAFEGCSSLKKLHIPDKTFIEVEMETKTDFMGTYYLCASPLQYRYWSSKLPIFTTVLSVKKDSPAHRALLGSEEYGMKYEVR